MNRNKFYFTYLTFLISIFALMILNSCSRNVKTQGTPTDINESTSVSNQVVSELITNLRATSLASRSVRNGKNVRVTISEKNLSSLEDSLLDSLFNDGLLLSSDLNNILAAMVKHTLNYAPLFANQNTQQKESLINATVNSSFKSMNTHKSKVTSLSTVFENITEMAIENIENTGISSDDRPSAIQGVLEDMVSLVADSGISNDQVSTAITAIARKSVSVCSSLAENSTQLETLVNSVTYGISKALPAISVSNFDDISTLSGSVSQTVSTEIENIPATKFDPNDSSSKSKIKANSLGKIIEGLSNSTEMASKPASYISEIVSNVSYQGMKSCSSSSCASESALLAQSVGEKLSNFTQLAASEVTTLVSNAVTSITNAVAEVAPTTDTTAISQTLTETFNSVANSNNAPVLSGANNATTINEDDSTSSGTLLSAILSGYITDSNSSDSSGVAIVGLDSDNGSWQYKLVDGNTFTSLSSLSNGAAILLGSDTYIRFVPTANYNGTASFTFRAWDQSTGSNGNANIDATTNGGSSAFSADSKTATIIISAVNDAPVLSGANNLTAIDENDSTSAGTSVKSIISQQITDVDSDSLEGIAVSAIDAANGSWYYKVSGGSWTEFASLSTTSATLLNSATLIRFAPTSDYYGSATITFLAWDQSSGTNGQTGADVSTSGGSTAFSSDSKTASITINSVNDAPVFSGANALTAIVEDDSDSVGTLVSAIISGQLADVDSSSVEGVAVVTLDTDNGSWYFKPSGGSWTQFGSVSESSATLLASDTLIRFVPTANYNGTANITVRAWDQSSGTNGQTGVDVSSNGNTTAFSSDSQNTTITISALNDAPVLSGANNLTTVTEDDSNPSGDLVSAIISGQSSDGDSGASSGMAVITLDSDNGTWQYKLSGGSWNAFGAVSNTSAMLLASTATIRFVPTANYNGSATITFRSWDQTSGSDGDTEINVSTNGSTTAFSSDSQSATITISAINDAPVLSASNNFTDIDENDSDTSGDLVSALMSGNVSDNDSGASSGMAVITLDSDNGTWQYKLSGGAWTAFGSVSNTSAMLLASTATIRFVPDSDYEGSPTLTYRAWDQTNGSDGDTEINVSTNGDSTAFSSDSQTATITINPYQASGTLDFTFNTVGYQTHGLDAGAGDDDEQANGVNIDSNGKILLTGQSDASTSGNYDDMITWRYNIDGSLDTTFSDDGYLTSSIGNQSEWGMSIREDSSGNIYIWGDRSDPTKGYDMTLYRYTSAGVLDTTFSGDGLVILTGHAGNEPSDYPGKNILFDGDGKFILCGMGTNPNYEKSALTYRLNTDGTLDTTYDSDGYTLYHPPGGDGKYAYYNAVALDGDGKIVATGMDDSSGTQDMIIHRFTTTGALDTTFDTDGKVIHSNTVGTTKNEQARQIAIDGNGNIIVVGFGVNSDDNQDMVIWRYTSAGVLDTTFDTDGIVVSAAAAGGTNGDDGAYDVKIDDYGKIVVVGCSTNVGGDLDMTIWRYNTDGSLDTTFDTDGIVTHPSAAGGSGDDCANSLVITDGGKLVIGGYSTNAAATPNKDMALWVYE